MLLVHPNIKVIHKLVRPPAGGWLSYAGLSASFNDSQVAQLPGFRLFDHLFQVAHFAPEWWLSMVRIIQLTKRINNSSTPISSLHLFFKSPCARYSCSKRFDPKCLKNLLRINFLIKLQIKI